MSNEFVPDILINPDTCAVHRWLKVYLNGVELPMCFEARVTFLSFVEPAFGEVVLGREPLAISVETMPRLGEFERNRTWAHLCCGKVQLVADADHIDDVAQWLDVYQRCATS